MDTKEIIQEKLDFYLKKKIKVHITKHNKDFVNGVIYKKESIEIYLVREDRSGDIRVFLNEIFDVEEYKDKKKEDNNESN